MEQSNNKYINMIQELLKNNTNIFLRKLNINSVEISILYISHITDRTMISQNVIKPILEYRRDDVITASLVGNSIITVDEVFFNNDESQILQYILDGKSIILLSNDNMYLVANTVKIEKRNVEAPQVESTLSGAKDAFTENIDSNLSLIQYRIKDSNLKIDKYRIGKRTKTNVAIVYASDIANPTYVNEIKKRLEAINVDKIINIGEVQKFISDKVHNLFPQTGVIERSDTACENIFEGKICILVEGCSLVIVAPNTFMDFIDCGEDFYSNTYYGVFAKSLRLISILLTLTLSSLYVALVAFNSDIVPTHYILALANSRETVPFNAVLEASIMEIMAEILREASVRLPKQIGSTLGIVGTIVIGQAAVVAGLVSPLIVITISISTMCSFIAPDFNIISPFRLLKFVMIFFTGLFGIFGFVAGLTVIVINLISVSSIGEPYYSPIAPLDFKKLRNYFFK